MTLGEYQGVNVPSATLPLVRKYFRTPPLQPQTTKKNMGKKYERVWPSETTNFIKLNRLSPFSFSFPENFLIKYQLSRICGFRYIVAYSKEQVLVLAFYCLFLTKLREERTRSHPGVVAMWVILRLLFSLRKFDEIETPETFFVIFYFFCI